LHGRAGDLHKAFAPFEVEQTNLRTVKSSRCLRESPNKPSAGTANQEFARTALPAAELRNEFESYAKPVALPPNCILFREGDPSRSVYFLRKGEASFTIRAAQRNLPCFAIGTGSFVGLSAVIAGLPFALTATASPGTDLLQMERERIPATNREPRRMVYVRVARARGGDCTSSSCARAVARSISCRRQSIHTTAINF
jgi:CRP-like cAMP-binding protein